ncbi:hypothetical protein FRC03_010872 [Tulasnella sp. 419]|nr:hypothetical protein FRC03_010872 [Tulasnella sp. 419]
MSLKSLYDRQGYVVVPNLVSPGLHQSLQAACTRVIKKTRDGIWTRRRTVGKQFPPYDSDNPDSWGVQHVMHPDLNEPEFATWYGSDALLGVVTELLECGEDKLQMELFNLLINPLSHEFALRWHRDDIEGTATEEEEREALKIPHYGVQWNTALYDDDSLFIVPCSHTSPRTPSQRSLSLTQLPPENPFDMPGAIQVHLKAGETVFYNNNILHCARYSPQRNRVTLHACIGDSRGGSKRARNILQHDLKWMREQAFEDALLRRIGGQDGIRLNEMRKKLLHMADNVDEDQVGYSLSG